MDLRNDSYFLLLLLCAFAPLREIFWFLNSRAEAQRRRELINQCQRKSMSSRSRLTPEFALQSSHPVPQSPCPPDSPSCRSRQMIRSLVLTTLAALLALSSARAQTAPIKTLIVDGQN